MIFEINNVDVRRGSEAAFEAAFAQCLPLLLRVAGCRGAELLRSIERPDRYIVQVTWESLTDHVEGYPSTPEAAEVRGLLRPLIAHAEPMHFEAVPRCDVTLL